MFPFNPLAHLQVTWGNDVFVVYGLCAMAAILVIVCSLSACFGPRAPGIALGRVAGGFLLMCYFVGLTGVVLCSQVPSLVGVWWRFGTDCASCRL